MGYVMQPLTYNQDSLFVVRSATDPVYTATADITRVLGISGTTLIIYSFVGSAASLPFLFSPSNIAWFRGLGLWNKTRKDRPTNEVMDKSGRKDVILSIGKSMGLTENQTQTQVTSAQAHS